MKHFYRVSEGFERNPLKRYRNFPCPCQSGKKIKRCHGLIDLVPTQDAQKLRGYLRALSMAGFIEARSSEIVS